MACGSKIALESETFSGVPWLASSVDRKDSAVRKERGNSFEGPGALLLDGCNTHVHKSN